MADSRSPTTKSSPLVGSKRRSSSAGDEPKKRHKTDSPVAKQCSLTDRFFLDMAATIAQSFPVSDFAEAHSCSARDVLDALSAVVLSPLREPQPWHGAASVSEYGQVLIDEWKGRQTGRAEGTASRPIVISDTSCCSGPSQPSASGGSLDTHISISSTSKTESSSEGDLSPSTPSEGITKESPGVKEVKTPVKDKPARPSRESSAARREVRLDIYSTPIPVDKWIDGYHIPAPRKVKRDALSDAEFYKMLAEGWFD